MSPHKVDVLERALAREKEARKRAEKILEDTSFELLQLNQKLTESNLELGDLLHKKNLELKGLFENIIDAYVVINLQGVVVKMNEAATSLLGYDLKKEKINLYRLVHRKDKIKVREGVKELIREGVLTRFQLRIVTKDLKQKIVQINFSTIYDEDKKPIAAQGIVRDITKQIKDEALLVSSENRLATLVLNLDSAVLLEDENHKIVLTNSKFCELFSIPVLPRELVGRNCVRTAQSNKKMFKRSNFFVSRIEELIQKKETVLGEILDMVDGRVLKRDYTPIFIDGEYKGHLWSYKDVTLESKYHEGIEVEKQKYSSIIANMNLGLLEVSNEDEILMSNQSFSEMSGYSQKELLGKKAKDLFLEGEYAIVSTSEINKRLEGISTSYELEVKTKEGEKKYWLISGGPNYNINGEVIGSIGIHLDITDLKNLQSQKEILVKKLEKSNDELHEYAHIVSHDLKSPLRSLYALVHWLKEDNGDVYDAASLHNFSLIETTLEKMEQLISDILTYSSVDMGGEVNTVVDLNTVLEDLQKILFIPKHISLKIVRKLPSIHGDRVRFQQLFQNIISNSVRYIDKEKGLIEVDVIERPSYYQFSIKDNGIGIEKKNYDKIFKIFQSLNTNKESTGIGLSIVKKIVDSYKGEVWLDSEVGKGTTFYFTLIK